ncbi:MAG: cupredoxin domain-containing protein [Actinomycetota bacterium]
MTESRGTAVRIRNFCFGPTILRAQPGDQVTFVNRDGVSHTVLGANASWGSYRQLRTGDDVSYEFRRAGVYPFVCTYHVGMIGAVVVGGPGAPMTATGTDARAIVPVREPDVATTAAVNEVQAPTTTLAGAEQGLESWAVVAIVVAAILAAGVALGWRRRRGAVLPSGVGGAAS